MDDYLRIVCLILAGLFVFIIWKSWSQYRALKARLVADREHHDFSHSSYDHAEEPSFKPAIGMTDYFNISIFAKPNSRFASYDLLQAIAATGMQFGEMNIFHYYQRTPQGKHIILFSLASATKPGKFDLDRMGDFSCVGLTLFMDIKNAPNPLQAFYLMVNTAEQLAEDLDGELRADPKTTWSEDHFNLYQQRLLNYDGSPA